MATETVLIGGVRIDLCEYGRGRFVKLRMVDAPKRPGSTVIVGLADLPEFIRVLAGFEARNRVRGEAFDRAKAGGADEDGKKLRADFDSAMTALAVLNRARGG